MRPVCALQHMSRRVTRQKVRHQMRGISSEPTPFRLMVCPGNAKNTPLIVFVLT